MFIRMTCHRDVVEARELDIDEGYCEQLTDDINKYIVGDPIATLTPDEVAAIYTGDYEDEETEAKFTRVLTFKYGCKDIEPKTFTSSFENCVRDAIMDALWDCDPEWFESDTYNTEAELIRN